jgi:hypothetical protein
MLLLEPTKNKDEYSYKHLIELAHVLGFKYSIASGVLEVGKNCSCCVKRNTS